MQRILFAWELGAGLGHVGTFLPIANLLQERGHSVVAAVKQLSAIRLFSGRTAPFPVLSSPPEASPCRKSFPITHTFSQILHNIGFGDVAYLKLKVQAWLDLFAVTKSETILCDHSPTAQLAAWIARRRFILLGTGFTCPPADLHLPVLDRRGMPTREQQMQHENQLLNHCNQVIGEYGGQSLENFSNLYSHAAETLLLTHQELDHFPTRDKATYYGSWNFIRGAVPQFPSGDGPRVFGYLKSSSGTEELLQQLRQTRWPALIVGTSFSAEFIKKNSSEQLQLTNLPVDNQAAAEWCDFAILNATHASVAVMLKAGKPILCIPLQLEQLLMSRRIADLKMGGVVVAKNAESFKLGLQLMNERYSMLAKNAQQFAERYRAYHPQQALQAVTDRIENLANV